MGMSGSIISPSHFFLYVSEIRPPIGFYDRQKKNRSKPTRLLNFWTPRQQTAILFYFDQWGGFGPKK
jgi:hypothetical protein